MQEDIEALKERAKTVTFKKKEDPAKGAHAGKKLGAGLVKFKHMSAEQKKARVDYLWGVVRRSVAARRWMFRIKNQLMRDHLAQFAQEYDGDAVRGEQEEKRDRVGKYLKWYFINGSSPYVLWWDA